MENNKQKHFQTFQGTVMSIAMNKTVVVNVDRMRLNTKYQKKYRVSRKYHVHNELEKVAVGDLVSFMECRPLSKTKRWRLTQVISKI